MKKLPLILALAVLLFPRLVQADFSKDLASPNGKDAKTIQCVNCFDTPYGRGTHAEAFPPDGYSSLSPCNVSFTQTTTTQTFTAVPLALWTPKSTQLVLNSPVYNFTSWMAIGAFTGVTTKNSASISGSDLYLHKDKSFKAFGRVVTLSGVLGIADEFQVGQKGRIAGLVGFYVAVK